MTESIPGTMYLVRSGDLSDDTVLGETWEFSVLADADFVGEVTFGPFYFTIWEIGDTSPGTERALCLRVKHPVREVPEGSYWDAASPDGYYHGGGIAEEVVTLASLFLRRRMRVGSVVRMGDLPRMFTTGRSSRPIDAALLEGTINLATLGPWFSLVLTLNPALHQRFILSAKFYQQALQRTEEDPTTAYLHLVSAIEVLSGDFDIGPVSLADYDSALETLVGQITDDQLQSQVRSAILAKQQFIGRRFKNFILHHIDETFWTEQPSNMIGAISASDLPKLLRRVYDQRSRTLHRGEPFPPSASFAPHQGEEMPLGLSETSGDRRWDANEFVPHLHFFERLTRHVLLNYLQAHSSGRLQLTEAEEPKNSQ